jgi:hypothetical protein
MNQLKVQRGSSVRSSNIHVSDHVPNNVCPLAVTPAVILRQFYSAQVKLEIKRQACKESHLCIY